MPRISIVIKALNEEVNIRGAIESSLAALANIDGEVIVADSASIDRTIEIAKQFPVSIVQLEDPRDQCCGVGPQLGYEHSFGQYVYILDGDMELKAPFLERAVAILDRDQAVAGVGGYIHEMRTDNLEVQGRVQRFNRLRPKGDLLDVDCLNGGGLYRRSAIADVGYLSDRNLHAFEEYDLGARLRVKGWRLMSLEEKAVDHYSYAIGSWRLLWRRIKSGRFLSSGELLRAAIDGHYVRHVLREVRILLLAIGVWIYWGLVLLASNWVASAAALSLIALVLPVVLMTFRTRSLKLGFFSVLTWHISAVGFLVGFFRRRRSPSVSIASKIVQEAPKAGLTSTERAASN
jgi:GT2 family glycosyltransferase